ncbi:hypothetical protein BD309DRAFT_440901 [Dichomitus squalens]|nr:hypothetical protein BD309DRAFT_440901 [Dichomitus squalens]
MRCSLPRGYAPSLRGTQLCLRWRDLGLFRRCWVGTCHRSEGLAMSTCILRAHKSPLSMEPSRIGSTGRMRHFHCPPSISLSVRPMRASASKLLSPAYLKFDMIEQAFTHPS